MKAMLSSTQRRVSKIIEETHFKGVSKSLSLPEDARRRTLFLRSKSYEKLNSKVRFLTFKMTSVCMRRLPVTAIQCTEYGDGNTVAGLLFWPHIKLANKRTVLKISSLFNKHPALSAITERLLESVLVCFIVELLLTGFELSRVACGFT